MPPEEEIAGIAVRALLEIKSDQGKVCENFEICNHVSCASSVASWMIAAKALADIGYTTEAA